MMTLLPHQKPPGWKPGDTAAKDGCRYGAVPGCAGQFDGRNNSVAEVLGVRLNYMAALQPWLRAACHKFLNE